MTADNTDDSAKDTVCTTPREVVNKPDCANTTDLGTITPPNTHVLTASQKSVGIATRSAEGSNALVAVYNVFKAADVTAFWEQFSSAQGGDSPPQSPRQAVDSSGQSASPGSTAGRSQKKDPSTDHT